MLEEKKWYSQETCFSCHYNLKQDPEKLLKKDEKWQERTGCPKCSRSFID